MTGIDELKDAIIDKFQRDQGLAFTRSQIVVSCGAKHTLFNLALALFEAGDEVIIPTPILGILPRTNLSGRCPAGLSPDKGN